MLPRTLSRCVSCDILVDSCRVDSVCARPKPSHQMVSGAVDHLEEKAVKGTVKDCDNSLARRSVSPASLSESVMIEKVAILESSLPNRSGNLRQNLRIRKKLTSVSLGGRNDYCLSASTCFHDRHDGEILPDCWNAYTCSIWEVEKLCSEEDLFQNEQRILVFVNILLASSNAYCLY